MIDIKNYDENNIFAKILRNENPLQKVFENEYSLAFKDISPQSPIHILIIPKKPFCSLDDFLENAEDKFLVGFLRSIKKVKETLKIKNGYRIITNVGSRGKKFLIFISICYLVNF